MSRKFYATRTVRGLGGTFTEYARGEILDGMTWGVHLSYLFAKSVEERRIETFRTSTAEFGSCGWTTISWEQVPLDARLALGEVPEFFVTVGGYDCLELELDTVRDGVVIWAGSLDPGTRLRVAARLRELAFFIEM